MKKVSRTYAFMKAYRNLEEVLTDRKLASLGDAYINLAYSLALSIRRKEPSGAKVKGTILAEAFRKVGLREYMPSRMTRHTLADAAEALMVYAWLHDDITLNGSVEILEKASDPTEGISQLLARIKDRIKFS